MIVFRNEIWHPDMPTFESHNSLAWNVHETACVTKIPMENDTNGAMFENFR
jgi:hypothetical protein